MVQHIVERVTGEGLAAKLDELVNKDRLEVMSIYMVGGDYWMIVARKGNLDA